MKSHPLAMGLYLVSWLIVIKLGGDVLFGAYPDNLPVRALKQSIGA